MWIIEGMWKYYFNMSGTTEQESISTDDTLGIIWNLIQHFQAPISLTAKISHGTSSGELEYGTFPDSMYTVEPEQTGVNNYDFIKNFEIVQVAQ